MPFADPHACPDCRGAIDGESQCPHCGLDLTSVAIRQLWQTLLQADALVAQARAPISEPVHVSAATLPAYNRDDAPAAPRVRSTITTGTVLLGLGALFLLVAGFVFITVSWGSLGVTGRALVLLAFTAVVGAAAAWATRRTLRGSAEALWAVFLGLFTLDWFSAWAEGLWGLDEVPFAAVATVWSAVAFAIGSLIVTRSRPHVGTLLVTPMIVAGAAPWFGAGSLAVRLSDTSEWSPFWVAVSATAFLAVFVGAALRLRHVVTWGLLAMATGLGAVLAIGSAAVEAVESPSLRQLTTESHGLPTMLVAVAAVVAGFLVPKSTAAAAALASLSVALLVVLPVEESWPERGAYVVVAGIVVLAALVLRGKNQWSLGGRIATGLAALGLSVVALPWVANLLTSVTDGADGDGGEPFWTRSTTIPENPGPWWVALVVFGAVTSCAVLARWWPETAAVRDMLEPISWVFGAIGLLSVVAAAEAPFVVLAAAMIATGAVLAEALSKQHLAWRLGGPALVAVAPFVPLPSRSATLVIWLLAAVVLGVVAIRSTDRWRRDSSAFAAASFGMGAAGIAALLVEADDSVISLSLIAAAGVGLIVASLVLRVVPGRIAVEAGAALVASSGLVFAAANDVSIPWQAALWTVVGVVLVLLGLATSDRRLYGFLGSGALGVAYVLRLVASDVDTVEAYTLPFAALLLAAGLWSMRGDDPPSSLRALGPGVTLALLPSLPQALDEPASLRALLLGLGALLLLAVGVWKHWKAPFVGGAAVLVVLAVANLGPYALALPRWTLIAAAGALLLGSGVTWEDRVRDGRAAARFVDSMR